MQIDSLSGIPARCCGQRHHFAEFRQDQVEDLSAFHFQRPFAEEIVERIFQAVTRHLQYALINGKDHHILRRGGFHMNRQVFTRFHDVRRCQRDPRIKRLMADAERLHAEAQRAHKDFIGVNITDKLHVNIAVAGQFCRYADFLHRVGGVRAEPHPLIHFVALNGDNTAAGVRRADGNFNLFTRFIFLFIQRQLQFRIAIQRAGNVRVTGDGVVGSVQHITVRIFRL